MDVQEMIWLGNAQLALNAAVQDEHKHVESETVKVLQEDRFRKAPHELAMLCQKPVVSIRPNDGIEIEVRELIDHASRERATDECGQDSIILTANGGERLNHALSWIRAVSHLKHLSHSG
jgi:hypothetical protein